jgi:hypothetical protein
VADRSNSAPTHTPCRRCSSAHAPRSSLRSRSLPLAHVKRGLQSLAPSVVQLDGDGSVLVPQLIRNMSKHDAARTLVIFDGEKRQAAYTAPQGSHCARTLTLLAVRPLFL